jgi:uroporphyrinogen decarboxylase
MTTSPGRERLTAIVSGQPPDRPPVTFWRHFYDEENDPRRLADALLRFHREFGWDWIKLNPRASYHLEDWGYRFAPSTDPLVKPVAQHRPVQSVADWKHIDVRKPTEGALGEHLQAIRNVKAGAGGDPVLMTLFTPLSVAGDLVPDDRTLLQHLREAPDQVTPALEALTQTFELFAAEALNAGADGLFFATTQWASRRLLTAADYERWGRPYDLRVLAKAAGAPFNLLHVCSAEALLTELADYPVALFNWGFADPGNPDVTAGLARLNKPVIGGVDRKQDLLESDPRSVYEKVVGLKAKLQAKPWGCGPDCSIYPHSKPENLRAVKAAIEGAAF